jgi:ClpP class serine protease
MTAKVKTDTKKEAKKPVKKGFMAKVKNLAGYQKDSQSTACGTVVRLSGVIGQVSAFKSGLTIQGVAHQLDEAFENDKAKAVALIINSPGGSPVQSSLIGKRIPRFGS